MTDHLDPLQVRVIVTDANVLGRLDPAAVAAYLAHAGWTQVGRRKTGTVWALKSEPDGCRLFLPDDQSYGDYPYRLAELLGAVAVTEQRSQLATLADFFAAHQARRQRKARERAERRFCVMDVRQKGSAAVLGQVVVDLEAQTTVSRHDVDAGARQHADELIAAETERLMAAGDEDGEEVTA
jgi:hypothetical protein